MRDTRATATHMQVKSDAFECVMQPLSTLSIGFSNKTVFLAGEDVQI